MTTKSHRSRGISSHPSWSLAVLVLALAALVPCLGAAEDTVSVRHRRSLPGETPGKRITSNLVAELGKRPRELYSFGIGKRSISAKEMAEYLAEEAAASHQPDVVHPTSQEEAVMNQDVVDDSAAVTPIHLGRPHLAAAAGSRVMAAQEKRDPYAFGLGKREYGFGMGRKRDPYAFGLGKRDPYSFGLGKRDPYAFGLGKRDPYSFGLGKRDPYSFGLGKRDPYSFGLGKRDPYSFGLGK